jgi:hypothetical protein
MNKRKLALVLLLSASLTSCATSAGTELSWVESGNGREGGAKRVPIGSDRIVLLGAAAEAAAIDWMQNTGVESIPISDLNAEMSIVVIRDGLGGPNSTWYLVRAIGDGGGGVFSGFESGADVYVVYNKLGSCKPLYSRVVAIRLDAPPRRVFADCGGGR